MTFLLDNNKFQAWKTFFPKYEAVHERYCMYRCRKPELVAPLHVASSYGLTWLTALLLAKGKSSDVSAVQEDGMTPLHFAAQNGHETLTRLLIEKGADVSAADEDEWTPLHRAARRGHEAVARLLIEKGADVSVVLKVLEK